MSGTYCSSALRNLRAFRVWGRTSLQTALTLIVLCAFAPAGNSKQAATGPSLPSGLPKPEDCRTPSDASNKSPSSSAKEPRQSKAESKAKPAELKSQNSASDDPMKLRFVLDEEQDIQGVSAECAKEQSDPESPQCQAEKSNAAAPHCERTSSPKHDLVLPASPKSGQQE